MDNTFTVPSGKFKIVSFVSLITKNIDAFPAVSKFPVKLICWFAFGSASGSSLVLSSCSLKCG